MLTLNNDCLASVTAVPDLFLEQYMPAANGEFVKVYLYLLKLVKDHQQDSTLSSMADFFSCTENDLDFAKGKDSGVFRSTLLERRFCGVPEGAGSPCGGSKKAGG